MQTAGWSENSLRTGLLLMMLALFGAGVAEAAEPQAERFTHLHVHGPVQVQLQQTGEPGVAVPAELADWVVAEIVDGVLYLDAKSGAAAAQKGTPAGTVVVTVAKLDSILLGDAGTLDCEGYAGRHLAVEASGRSVVRLTHLDVDDLSVQGSGSALFELSGRANHQVVDLVGMGMYQASHLHTYTAQVDATGAGNLQLHADELLDVRLSGLINVWYAGTPWVTQQISGEGRIVPVANQASERKPASAPSAISI